MIGNGFFEKVEKDRIGFAKKMIRAFQDVDKASIGLLKFYESKYPQLKKWLDDRRPYVDSLPDKINAYQSYNS